MEAEADGRLSLNRLTKRKCDGVYYTPEWVVRTIVDGTLGARLDDIKTELGFDTLPPLDDNALAEYRAYQSDRRRATRTAGEHVEFLNRYRQRLDRLRIVDPACGSGAFLIQALNRLVEEYRWVVAEQARIEGHQGLFDQDSIIRSILAHNIYGVDINPESVEIAKLALWLHTAAPGKPLCSLDANIRCGNSLVGPDFAEFYRQKHTTLFEQADENERERINAFDWEAAFPDVFAHGGFDCVIGHPPYIKLQHFRRAQADVADYLVEANAPDPTELASVVNQVENPDREPSSPDPTDLASVVKKVGERPAPNPTSTSTGVNPVGGKSRPLYASTQTGNFDMYLPFIEKGIRLLRPEGRMGYIAPNVWMVNDYGKGLRKHIHLTRALDRWLDFKSHQMPIPDATPEERAEVGCRARELQDLHTSRRDTIQKLDARLNSPQTVPVRPAPKPEWLWSDVGTPATWKQSPEAPAELAARALTAWAKARHIDALQAHIDELDILLQPGSALTVANTEDELVLTIGGREALRLYDRPDTPFIAAQWRHALRDTNVTEAYDGKRLLKHLLTLRSTTDATLHARILALDAEIATLDTTIAEREAALNTLIYRLYQLTPEEIATVEAG